MKRLLMLMGLTIAMASAPATMGAAETPDPPPPPPPPPMEEPGVSEEAEQAQDILPGPPPGEPCFTAEQIEAAEPQLRPTLPPCGDEERPPVPEDLGSPSDANPPPIAVTPPPPPAESVAPPPGDQEDWRPLQTLSPPAPAGANFGLRSAQDYIAIRQRPLFAPDRSAPRAMPDSESLVEIPVEQPPIEEEVVPEPTPFVETAPDWQLVGLVRSQSLNSAMFRKVGEADGFSLRRGESRDGWRLSEVGRFEVVLENENGQARLAFPSE